MNKKRIKIANRFYVSSGEVSPDGAELKFNLPTILGEGATLPRLKIKGAEYFLRLLKNSLLNEPATRYHIEAFVQFLRSATFVLQKVCSQINGFNLWYEQKRMEMRQDPLLSELVDLRNTSEKEGLVIVEYGVRTTMYFFRNGKVEARAATPKAVINNVTIENLIVKLEKMLETVSRIVEEAHEQGYVKVEKGGMMPFLIDFRRETADGQWEHFDPK